MPNNGNKKLNMNEDTELNICDVLCSWNKLNTNSNSKLVKTSIEDYQTCNDLILPNNNAEEQANNEKQVNVGDRGNTFTCSTCFKNLSSRSSLRIHLRIHSGDKNYCCEHCGKLFSHNATLIGHLVKFHNINGDTAHTCSQCNKIFGRKNALKIHMATHVGFKPFSCKICSKSFSQKITRDIHALTHTGKYDYSCDKCSRKFATRYKLKYHLKSHNNITVENYSKESSNLPEYHCLLCLKQFTNKDDLDKHCDSHNGDMENMEMLRNTNFQDEQQSDNLYCLESMYNTHENHMNGKTPLFQDPLLSSLNKKFICNFCGCNFPERRGLLHHIKMRHAVISAVRYNCFMCHKSFSQKSKLTFHMKRHTELPNFRCEICGKRYYRKDSLEKHKKIHIKTLTSCIICEKKFKTADQLKKHMILHKSLDYTCLKCGQTFTTKTAHKFHNEMHKGNFQFICNYCGKKFVRKCHYEEHIRIHSVISTIKCPICIKTFREDKLLKRHLKRCHSYEYSIGLIKLSKDNENSSLNSNIHSEMINL